MSATSPRPLALVPSSVELQDLECQLLAWLRALGGEGRSADGRLLRLMAAGMGGAARASAQVERFLARDGAAVRATLFRLRSHLRARELARAEVLLVLEQLQRDPEGLAARWPLERRAELDALAGAYGQPYR